MDIDSTTPDDIDSMDIDAVAWVAPPSATESSQSRIYELYTDEEGLWVIYKWQTSNPDARIEPFYNRWPPSRTSSRTCAWISVNGGLSPYVTSLNLEERTERFKRNVKGLCEEFQAIIAGVSGEVQEVTPAMFDALAVKYGVLSGKWMIYSTPENIDQLWRKVVRVVAFDRRYGQLKVSTRKVFENDGAEIPNQPSHPPNDGGEPVPGEGHVICVYVDDYTNKQDVDELRRALRLGAGVIWKIGFKPDVYTLLGIYKGNEWGIRPSRYHDADDYRGGGSGRNV
jgi:hypothetical protein